ncbi:MAG: prepilin-type N-terminal cleavage/methylation domain-containing protein [Gemmatimonadaceae bacterium]
MSHRRGMTLLEVVVALAIAGTALAAGATVIGFLTDRHERLGAAAVTSAVAVRETLRDWLAGADVGTTGRMRFTGTTHGTANAELRFVTSAATSIAPAALSARSTVRLFIDGASSRGLFAEIAPWPSGTPVIVSLVPEATGLEVRYVASIFGPRQWLTAWSSTSVLPAAVELRLTLAPASASTAEGSVVALPLTVLLGARR